MRSQFNKTIASIRLTQAAIASLAATIVGEFGIRATVAMLKNVDTWNLVNSRIRLVSDSSDELATKQQALFDIAQRTRTSYESVANLYARIARNTKTLNIEDEKRLKVTENIAKALIISGASATSADAALVQFTQGLAADALRGQELNSVMEQTPRLSQAIADGMKVQIGELRNLAKEGKLTAQTVLNALVSQSEALDKEFKQMTKTMGQGVQQVSNEWLRFLGNLDDAIGITQKVTQELQLLQKALEDEDKAAKGYQNHYIESVKSVLASIDLWIDRIIWISLNAYDGFTSFIPAVKAEWNIFIDWLSVQFLHFAAMVTEAELKIKQGTIEVVNFLTGIKIGDVQITKPLLGDELEKTKQEIKELQTLVKDADKEHLKLVAAEGEKIKKLTEFNQLWIQAAANRAAVTKQMRLDEFKANEKALKAAKEFQRKTSLFTRTGPAPSLLKAQQEKQAKEDRRRINALINQYDKERQINDALASRISLEAKLKILKEKIKEYPALEVQATADVEAAYKRIHGLQKEIAQIEHIKPQTIETKTKLERLNTDVLREQLKIRQTEKTTQEKQIALLKKAADITRDIGENKASKQYYETAITIDKTTDSPFIQGIKEAEAAVQEAKANYDAISEQVESYSKIEVRTADDILAKAKLETAQVKAQYDLEKKKTELKKKQYGWVVKAAEDFSSVFAETGSFKDTMKTMMEDLLSSMTAGDYGTVGSWVGVVVNIFRGMAKSTSEEIKQKLASVTGQTKFDSSVFSNMRSVFKDAQYPLLLATRETNRHLIKLESIFSRTSVAIANTSFSKNGVTYLESLNGNGGKNYNTSSSDWLGATTHSRTLVDSGLVIANQRLADAIHQETLNAQAYISARFDSSGFWGLFSSTSTRRETVDLPAEVKAQLAQAFNESYQTILTSAVALGFNEDQIKEQLGNQIVGIDFASLYDLDKEELATRLDEIFSDIFTGVVQDMDQFASLVEQFRKGTESDLETLIRLGYEYRQASQALNLAGLGIQDGYNVEVKTYNLPYTVGTDSAEVQTFGVKNLTEAQQAYVDQMREATGITEGFTEAMRASNYEAGQYIETIKVINVSAREQILSLVQQAGGIDEFTALVNEYTSNILTETERLDMERENLNQVFASYNLTVPKTIQGYKDLLAAQDTTTEAGRETYLMLLQMSGAFADITAEAEDAKEEVSDYVDRITRAITGEISPYTSDQQANFLEQFAALQDTSTTEGATNYLDSLEEALKASIKMSPTIEDYIGRFDAYIDAVQRTEKEKNITDLWEKAEDILMELRHQTSVTEQASYQQAL
jgi:tape measure domain-containing protein